MARDTFFMRSAIRRPAIRRFVTAMAVAIGALLFCQWAAAAGCLDGKRMVGVNLSGAEFASGKLPGTMFKDYVYPDADNMRHFQALGMNTFRLPFLWERLQPQLSGPLDPAELRKIEDTVAIARTLGVCLILDVHNYGQYRGKPIGSPEVPRAAFIDLWTRLLGSFKDPANTAFGLMNEPAQMTIAEWSATAQETVDALRKNGAKQLILVPGGGWSGAHSWQSKDRSGVANADAFRSFRDPASNYLIEVHQYADSDSSGTGNTCVNPSGLSAVMKNISQWAGSTRQRLFLGEFGVPVNDPCLQALAAIAGGTKDPAWGGWTYWAAGKWLGNYPFSIQPDGGGVDKPQMAVLKNNGM